ncbi:hypothetical protein SK128_022412 [Halocaridina rubra]|uniref:Uncharacterized protein n=1 Tax=Halocaridina rubra TaxID=373956 RepID=A0AAN9A733_HALRR
MRGGVLQVKNEKNRNRSKNATGKSGGRSGVFATSLENSRRTRTATNRENKSNHLLTPKKERVGHPASSIIVRE